MYLGVDLKSYSGDTEETKYPIPEYLHNTDILDDVNYWYNNGGIIAGMYEWSTPVIAEGFNLYYGIGAHLGSGFSRKSDTDVATFKIGADAVVGLEYKIPAAPIAISLDYRPFLNVIDSFDLGLYDVGLGLKFCF